MDLISVCQLTQVYLFIEEKLYLFMSAPLRCFRALPKSSKNFRCNSDQEAVMVIESVCQNRMGVSLAWQFFKEHINEFLARYGHGLFLMSKLIKCVTENFSTEEELTSVSEFFAKHPEIGCERTIRQAKENVSLNLYWKNRDVDSVASFLHSNT